MTKPKLTAAQQRYLTCLRDGRPLSDLRDATGRTRGISSVLNALRKAGLTELVIGEDGLGRTMITEAGRDWFNRAA